MTAPNSTPLFLRQIRRTVSTLSRSLTSGSSRIPLTNHSCPARRATLDRQHLQFKFPPVRFVKAPFEQLAAVVFLKIGARICGAHFVQFFQQRDALFAFGIGGYGRRNSFPALRPPLPTSGAPDEIIAHHRRIGTDVQDLPERSEAFLHLAAAERRHSLKYSIVLSYPTNFFQLAELSYAAS